MSELQANIAHYAFETARMLSGALQVARFSGTEGISRPFRFDLDLVSDDPCLDFSDMVNQAATFIMRRGDEPVPVHGLIIDFEQLDRTVDYVAYRAVLVPRLWRLSLTHQSRIFERKTVPAIVEDVLKEAGFRAADYRLMLSEAYPEREYTAQYRETDLAFVSRLFEHEGISYFFEHTEDQDVLVITDQQRTFQPIAGEHTVAYAPGAGMADRDEGRVQAFTCREQVVPGKVVLKDYNYRTPDADLKVESPVSGTMPGLYYEFGQHYKDVSDGRRLATVRTEEIASRRRVLRGRGTCVGFRSGYTFTLEGHYRSDLDGEYLLTEVEHRGSQWRALGLQDPSGTEDEAEGPVYGNTFRCIPAEVTYRPERCTPVPRVSGIMTAKVESGGGDYAYIDDDGRYRARMHFDLGEAATADATRPIRMSQPHSGPDYGIHFPNHADTELVWACIDGDVDRPLALATVPNPNNASPALSGNNYENVIRTKSGNQLIMDDRIDEEQLRLNTPASNLVLLDDKDDRIVITTTNGHVVTLDDANEHVTVRTSGGHVLVMDDEHQKITLQSTDGHRMMIDDPGEKMVISDERDENFFQIDIGRKQLTIKTAKGGIDILAPEGHINIKSKSMHLGTTGDTTQSAANLRATVKTDYELTAENTVYIEGQNGVEAVTDNYLRIAGRLMDISSTESTRLWGPRISLMPESALMLSCTGQTTIHGTPVKINCRGPLLPSSAGAGGGAGESGETEPGLDRLPEGANPDDYEWRLGPGGYHQIYRRRDAEQPESAPASEAGEGGAGGAGGSGGGEAVEGTESPRAEPSSESAAESASESEPAARPRETEPGLDRLPEGANPDDYEWREGPGGYHQIYPRRGEDQSG